MHWEEAAASSKSSVVATFYRSEMVVGNAAVEMSCLISLRIRSQNCRSQVVRFNWQQSKGAIIKEME